jgi:DNA-binding MarR family transcriptional regulator
MERSEAQVTAPPTCPERGDERLRLMGLLMAANNRLTRVVGRELEEACGLPLTWYDVLVNLALAPDGRLTMTGLSQGVLLTTGGVTRLVDRMVAAGLVERQTCTEDRRSVWVAVTGAGRERLAEATGAHLAAVQRHLVDPLSEADREVLARALATLAAGEPACGGRAPAS